MEQQWRNNGATLSMDQHNNEQQWINNEATMEQRWRNDGATMEERWRLENVLFSEDTLNGKTGYPTPLYMRGFIDCEDADV